MKTCFKCGVEKPRTEFYRHPQMGDGLLGKCKECTKADSSRRRLDNLADARAYDRERATLPHRKRLMKRISDAAKQRHPRRNAIRKHARRVHTTPPTVCEACLKPPETRLERHHPDYAQPTWIQWLCKPCHAKADRERRLSEAA